MANHNEILQSAADLAVLASDRADAASKIIHDVANGSETETVTTANGEVSTLAKAIKDITDNIEASSLAPEIEPVTLEDGVLEYTLEDMTTSGMALYIEGSREFDFTVVDSTTFRIPRQFPTGTKAWAVKRDIYTPNQEEAMTDADTFDGLESNQFLRSDSDNSYENRFTFGVDGTTEGSVRIERDAGNLRFRIIPAGIEDWDFVDAFGYQDGRWYFNNAPTVDNGSEIWHSGNDGEGSGLDADFLRGLDPSGFGRLASTNTWEGAQIFTDAETGEGEGVIRANYNGTRFSMVPHDGTDWNYNNEFGYENGVWYFDNAPEVNGNTVWHQGNLDPTELPDTGSENIWTGANIYGDVTVANSIRLYKSTDRTYFAPSDGTDWDYNDEFGYQGGWYFDSKPTIDGQLPVIEAETAHVTSVFTTGATTTDNLDVTAADSFVVDNSAAVTLNIINMDDTRATTITVLVEGNAGVDWDTMNTITWTDNTEPTQGASWTLYVLTHIPTRGWYGSLGGRA